MMRWGNYDTFNGAVRFVAAEVPSGLSQFPNPLPASQSLPPSFYLPSSQPSWWSTAWGTPPWPANGPDVSGGNIASLGGHANQIPAYLCYINSPTDSSYGSNGVRLFNGKTCYGSSGSTTVIPPTNVQVTVQ
jgi:hypothetical protein